jgi:hypothetical protein
VRPVVAGLVPTLPGSILRVTPRRSLANPYSVRGQAFMRSRSCPAARANGVGELDPALAAASTPLAVMRTSRTSVATVFVIGEMLGQLHVQRSLGHPVPQPVSSPAGPSAGHPLVRAVVTIWAARHRQFGAYGRCSSCT